VTVGGTRQVGDDGLQVRPEDREQIWSRACKYVPSLKVKFDGRVDSAWSVEAIHQFMNCITNLNVLLSLNLKDS